MMICQSDLEVRVDLYNMKEEAQLYPAVRDAAILAC